LFEGVARDSPAKGWTSELGATTYVIHKAIGMIVPFGVLESAKTRHEDSPTYTNSNNTRPYVTVRRFRIARWENITPMTRPTTAPTIVPVTMRPTDMRLARTYPAAAKANTQRATRIFMANLREKVEATGRATESSCRRTRKRY